MPESNLMFAKPTGAEPWVPSSRLLHAAMTGLFALAAGACGDDQGAAIGASEKEDTSSDLSEEEVDALCKDKVSEAADKALAEQDVTKICSDMVADAKKETQTSEPAEGDLPKLCESMVGDVRSELEANIDDMKAEVKMLKEQLAASNDEVEALKKKASPLLLTSDEKVINEEQKEYTFAELTAMCDERGGYTQVHAACGGHNACAGFSYGDWGPGAATLTEHSCSGVNGCLGLSCVDLPKDSGRTGKEIYEDVEFPDPLNNCGGCHGGYYDDSHEWVHDISRFAVYVFKDSTRTAENWLDRTPAEQERVVAFGARGVLADGTAYQNMGEYHGVLARAEVERVVAYIRTLQPAMVTTKTADP